MRFIREEQQPYKGQARDRHSSPRFHTTNVKIHPIETQSLSNIADYISQCSISKPNEIKVEKNEEKRRIGLVNSLTIHHSPGIHNTEN
jgi:hypothetical protein